LQARPSFPRETGCNCPEPHTGWIVQGKADNRHRPDLHPVDAVVAPIHRPHGSGRFTEGRMQMAWPALARHGVMIEFIRHRFRIQAKMGAETGHGALDLLSLQGTGHRRDLPSVCTRNARSSVRLKSAMDQHHRCMRSHARRDTGGGPMNQDRTRVCLSGFDLHAHMGSRGCLLFTGLFGAYNSCHERQTWISLPKTQTVNGQTIIEIAQDFDIG